MNQITLNVASLDDSLISNESTSPDLDLQPEATLTPESVKRYVLSLSTHNIVKGVNFHKSHSGASTPALTQPREGFPKLDEILPESKYAKILIEGMELLVNDLLEAEADYFCLLQDGTQKAIRINCRAGTYSRSIKTSIGVAKVQIVKLRLMQVRPSLPKRCRRLQKIIFSALIDILVNKNLSETIIALVKELLPLDLPEADCSLLVYDLTRSLSVWRARYSSGYEQHIVHAPEPSIPPVSKLLDAHYDVGL